jgi:transcriptional regulator with XRE-family HTH domain
MSEKNIKIRDFGAYLCAKRMEAGLSQKAAAIALGYSARDFLSRVENNRVSLPLSKIPLVAVLYGIDIRELAEAVIDEQNRIMEKRVRAIVKKAT